MKTRYAAYIVIDSKELIVFPRGKHNTFRTAKQAESALERKGLELSVDSRGIIREIPTGKEILTIAL